MVGLNDSLIYSILFPSPDGPGGKNHPKAIYRLLMKNCRTLTNSSILTLMGNNISIIQLNFQFVRNLYLYGRISCMCHTVKHLLSIIQNSAHFILEILVQPPIKQVLLLRSRNSIWRAQNSDLLTLRIDAFDFNQK